MNEKSKSTTEPKISEFKTRSDHGRAPTKTQIESQIKQTLSGGQLMSLGIYALLSVIVILISILALDLPVVSVCLIVIIETLLAACLHKIQLWLHGSVVIAQIICGVMFAQTIFILLSVLLYIAAIIALRFILTDD